ncbi:MAG: HAMP domain-containing protein [Deltaproteobacteria bacterium]|nr:MAG: HAMP domain-containing protein [Deltaproteobacteria bacterium]
MKIRLFYKFVIAFLAIGVAAVMVAGFLIERELKTDLTIRIGEEMAAGAQIIALMPAGEIAGHAGDLAERTRARLTLIDAAGRVTADSELGDGETDGHLNRSEIQEARLRGIGKAVRYSHTLKKEMLYVAIPLREGAQTMGYIRLSRPLADINRTINATGEAVFDILLGTVIVSFLIAMLFAVKMLSPIGRLAAFTAKVRMGDVSGALRIESKDEIGQLSDNINEIVTTLQEKIRTADAEKRKLESLFSGMSEGVMVLDAENRIESVNQGMEGMTGRPHGEVIGKTLLEAFRNIELHDALERFRERKETVAEEIGLGDDRSVIMDVTISAVQGEGGGERKTMLVFHDVTRLKKLERIRTDFVANVTHEIRTPLTAIIGFAETLQQGIFENRETPRKFLRTIRENAERLNRLVDDLLTLSGLELGEAKLHLEEVRIEEALDQVLAIVGARAGEKGLTIRKEIAGELPLILVDRDRLAQILINILDNAIKFTPVGGTIAITTSPGEEGCLTVRIADTGAGIPKGEIPRLGERFYRADKMRSREMGGTGLGLSIVKHLMMAHGGRVLIDSALGHGTTVSLYFPIVPESK